MERISSKPIYTLVNSVCIQQCFEVATEMIWKKYGAKDFPEAWEKIEAEKAINKEIIEATKEQRP